MEYEEFYNIVQYTLLALIIYCTAVLAIDRFWPDRTLGRFLLNTKVDSNFVTFPIDDSDNIDTNQHMSLLDDYSRSLSIIIAEKDGASVLPQVLEHIVGEMQTRTSMDKSFTWELIVVDDSSKDNSVNIVNGYSHTTSGVKLVEMHKISGMSLGLQVGACIAKGKRILFADLRAAENINEKLPLFEQIMDGSDVKVVFGSRNKLNDERENERGCLEDKLNILFMAAKGFIGISSVLDPQCPFVLMTREAAKFIIPNMHTSRIFGFTEMALLSEMKGYTMSEVDINWDKKNERKLTLRQAFECVPDILGLMFCYKINYWTLV